MNVWPVLAREARESSKQRTTQGIRLLALLAVGAVAIVMGSDGELRPGDGGRLFAVFHRTMFLATWLLVPLMAADSLSRERREGTLGLLFLTPLRPLDIVLAKGALHGLRGMTLWLAMVPVFILPILLGGLAWRQVVPVLLYDLSALMLALAAGLAASAGARRWSAAMVRAVCLAVLFCCGQVFLTGCSVFAVVRLAAPMLGRGAGSAHWPGWEPLFAVGWEVVLVQETFARMVTGRGTGGWAAVPLWASLVTTLFCVLATLLLVGWAAWRVRSNWQDHPRSALRRVVERGFTTPILGREMLDRWLRRSLERNPVGWLEQRSWAGRLVMFGWLAAVIGVLSGVVGQIELWTFSQRRHGVDWIEWLVAFPLLLSMAATSAGSFRRERETGVLELLLISPFKETQLVRGRLRGLYAQFLPSILLLVAGWSFLLIYDPSGTAPGLSSVFWFLIWALAVPCIGLFCSLRLRNFLAAWLGTLALAWVVPGMVQLVVRGVLTQVGPANPFLFNLPEDRSLQALVCLGVAAYCRHALIRQLRERRFQFNREVT